MFRETRTNAYHRNTLGRTRFCVRTQRRNILCIFLFTHMDFENARRNICFFMIDKSCRQFRNPDRQQSLSFIIESEMLKFPDSCNCRGTSPIRRHVQEPSVLLVRRLSSMPAKVADQTANRSVGSSPYPYNIEFVSSFVVEKFFFASLSSYFTFCFALQPIIANVEEASAFISFIILL